MALNTGSSKLNLALKTLRMHWDETNSRWNDPVSRAFEENHWLPLEAQVMSTLRGIDQLAQALASAQQECGE
jgi:hypothetical protein